MLVSSMRSRSLRFLQGTRHDKGTRRRPNEPIDDRNVAMRPIFYQTLLAYHTQRRKWSDESARGGKKLTGAIGDGSFNCSILPVAPAAARPLRELRRPATARRCVLHERRKLFD